MCRWTHVHSGAAGLAVEAELLWEPWVEPWVEEVGYDAGIPGGCAGTEGNSRR